MKIGSVELSNPRDSWSYWTGGKAHLKEAHIGEQMQGKDEPSARRTADEKSDAYPGELELKEPGSEPQLIPNLGSGSSEEPLQLPQNQHGQVTEKIPSNPEGICKPLSTLPVAMIPMQQPGSIHKEPNSASMVTFLPSGGYNSPPHMINSSPFAANDSIPGRGTLRGERSYSRANQRSYSLTMSSHPPFRITQPNSDPGRQRRGTFPQPRPGTAINSRQLHRVKSGLYTTPDPLQKRYSLRRSTSGATHSRAAEKDLL